MPFITGSIAAKEALGAAVELGNMITGALGDAKDKKSRMMAARLLSQVGFLLHARVASKLAQAEGETVSKYGVLEETSTMLAGIDLLIGYTLDLDGDYDQQLQQLRQRLDEIDKGAQPNPG